MIEVERKFRLNSENSARVADYLKVNGGEPDVHRQADKVFLYQVDSFKKFTPGDPVMRLRSMGDTTILTYKRIINAEGDRIEHEVAVDSAATAEAILKELGYLLAVNVEKVRSEYRIGDIAACLDDVVKLGMFLELEVISQSEDEIATAEQRIMSVASEMGLTAADIETKKYDQLLDDK